MKLTVTKEAKALDRQASVAFVKRDKTIVGNDAFVKAFASKSMSISSLRSKGPKLGVPGSSQEDYYRKLFDRLDSDGSGFLDREEIRELGKQLLGRDLSEGEVDAAMLQMDLDGGGEVEFDEFSKCQGG